MKKIYFLFLLFVALSIFCLSTYAQTNLPYTLHFTTESTSAWSGGIARDGEGGTQKINGLDIQIFAATSSFTPLAGATMMWRDVGYFGTPGFTGITPGPDPAMTNNGVPAMVIKSANSSVDFSLDAITLLDWGGVSPTISTYNNGIFKGTLTVNLPTDGTIRTLTQTVELLPAVFDDVDEIRFYPQAGAPVFWIAMNAISLKPASATLPVYFVSFSGKAEKSHTTLQWTTGNERNVLHFEVQKSGNGSAFTTIGNVKAKGAGTAASYKFADAASAGKTFYRVKQTDREGKFVYSSVILVDAQNKGQQVQLYPNPAVDVITIANYKSSIKEIRIYNSGGTLVQSKKVNADTAKISIVSLLKGIYYVAVVSAKETIYKQVVKE